MIHTSWPFTSTLTSLLAHFKKNKMSLILLVLVLAICLPIDAQKPRVVLTGDEAKAYQEMIKTKSGDGYGLGFSAESFQKMLWIFAANMVAWLFLMTTKLWEIWRGDKKQIKSDIHTTKENWIQVASDIAFIKSHMVTKPEVQTMIREEVNYLRQNKGKF